MANLADLRNDDSLAALRERDLAPAMIEFWQGRRNRLDDRLRRGREPASGRLIDRLSP